LVMKAFVLFGFSYLHPVMILIEIEMNSCNAVFKIEAEVLAYDFDFLIFADRSGLFGKGEIGT